MHIVNTHTHARTHTHTHDMQFRDISLDVLVHIINILTPGRLNHVDETLVEAGKHGDEMYIITAGEARGARGEGCAQRLGVPLRLRGSGADGLLRVASCTLRVARCVLHVACCTLHVACYMLPCCALQVMARTDLRGLPAGFEMPVYLIEEGRCFGELNVLGLISKHAAEPTPLPPHRAGSAGLRCLRFLPPARYCEYQAWHTHARERTHAHAQTHTRADTRTRSGTRSLCRRCRASSTTSSRGCAHEPRHGTLG